MHGANLHGRLLYRPRLHRGYSVFCRKFSISCVALHFESFECKAMISFIIKHAAKSRPQASNSHGYRSTKSKYYSARDNERLGKNPWRQSANAFHRDYARMPPQLSRLVRLRRYAPWRWQAPYRVERFPRRCARQWRPGLGPEKPADARVLGGRRTDGAPSGVERYLARAKRHEYFLVGRHQRRNPHPDGMDGSAARSRHHLRRRLAGTSRHPAQAHE